MTSHEPTLRHLSGGTITITCSCGKFEATADASLGKPPARESHLLHAHKLHTKDAK